MKLRGSWGVWFAAAAVAVVVAGGTSSQSAFAAGHSSPPGTVRTTAGTVRGLTLPETTQYLGIDYAKAPTGALRWQPPQPVAPWSGVHTVTAEPPNCPQAATEDPGLTSDSLNENCLALDVITPARYRPDRPVYVFVHGGGFTVGHLGYENMNQFVEKTGAVAVTINYRLGALGFLDLPGVTSGPSAGSLGIADQISALHWVQRNISAFGGDPHQVTIGGQSAGGGSICALLDAPSAAGLFDGAVLESPGPCTASRPKATVQTESAALANSLGCASAATEAACLRGKSVESIVQAQGSVAGGWSPETGTAFLPGIPSNSFTSGHFNHVPVLLGSNGNDAPGAPCLVQGLASSLSKWVPTYRYDFDDVTAPPLPGRPADIAGSGPQHSAELEYLYLFNGIQAPLDAQQQNLADSMIGYWGNFVTHANPNGSRLIQWPRFTAKGALTMDFDQTGTHVINNISTTYGCA